MSLNLSLKISECSYLQQNELLVINNNIFYEIERFELRFVKTRTCCPYKRANFSLLECQNYQNLTNGDRKDTSGAGLVTCDSSLGPGWFRFQGDAGTKMATTCVPDYHCGTHSTGWLNGAHPTVAEGQVTRQVCFNWSSNCCTWSINIQVQSCGDFFIYYISGTPPEHPCHLRYCGAD